MDSLIDVAWLRAHLDDPDLRILDCSVAFEVAADGPIRFFSGRDDFEEGHIPGSAFADLLGDLSDAASDLQFALPDAAQFGAAMGRLGVAPHNRVVVYDRSFAMWATRVWWMLRAFGHERVAVLDGGFSAWSAAGAPVSRDPSRHEVADYPAKLAPGWFADREEVRAGVGRSDTCLIDALLPEMYRGEIAPYARAGHITGAINIPAVALIDPDTRCFLDEGVLRARFDEALGKPRVVTYCGGGIAATADAFVLHRLGHRAVSVYDASLSEWSADPDLPMTTGDRP